MSDEREQPGEHDDPSADTEAFRAFAHRRDTPEEWQPAEGGRRPVPFRLLTLGVALAVFVLLGWLLLQL